MKLQSIIWSVITMFLLNTASTYANPLAGEMLIRIQKESSTTLSVKLANLKKMRTEISITDLQGKPWFSEYAWGNNGYAKELNLKDLPMGTYVLVIKNKMKTHIQALAKQGNQISLFEMAKDQNTELARLTNGNNTTVTSSFSIAGKEAIDLKISNLRKSTTTIQLNNLEGALLVKEIVVDQNGFAKKINLKGLPRGTYFFTIQHKQLQLLQIVLIDRAGVKLQAQQILDHGDASNLVLR
ncbi:MAG: hypothetical protein AAF806_15895 [Bacteroidota bacterium]